ncbi:hypothetical protein N7534_005023 [Penicillium rubens]|nr:hypothetical protein N7534_005023 [Penicillium rubens]
MRHLLKLQSKGDALLVRHRSLAGVWRRIVKNLLGNAMKWTTAGFIEIALSKAKDRSDSQPPLVHLSITDTGRGIAPDFIKHKLFVQFSQEDPLSEGVGLGLSMVQQLRDARIFKRPKELTGRIKQLHPRPSSKQALAHVLILDDNEINVKKSSNLHYDFVLMDISMPVIDSLVSTSKIREFEREHNIRPSCIMAVTGVSSAGSQDQATTAGIDNYLIKSLSLHALKALMNIA